MKHRIEITIESRKELTPKEIISAIKEAVISACEKDASLQTVCEIDLYHPDAEIGTSFSLI